MDGPTIAAKVARGYAIASARLGYPCSQFRPSGPNNPTSGTPRATLNVAVSVLSYEFTKPPSYKEPGRWLLVDTTQTQVGDYLTGHPDGTLFIASQDPVLPVLGILCNATLSVTQPAEPTQAGLNPYGGRTIATDVAIATGWPASVLIGTKGEATPEKLPGDTRAPWWRILLPAAIGTLAYGMRLTDQLGRAYIVSATELGPLGWNLTAALAEV